MTYRLSSTVILTVFTLPLAAAHTPQAGSWEVITILQGAPSGESTTTARACISAPTALDAFEQSLLNISTSSGEPPKGGPKCTVLSIQREGVRSQWQASCAGPFGAMQGSGSATRAPTEVSLQQTMELKTPFGAKTLKQSLQARRLGACQ
jgi:Protein of unknown function (DUF3617)